MDLNKPVAGRSLATASCMMGLTSIGLTALAFMLSFTTYLDDLPIRDALAVLCLLGFPVALCGVGAGVLGWGGHRIRAGLGVALSAAAVLVWILMVFAPPFGEFRV